MLVHVTRYQAVQRLVAAQVQRYIDRLRDEVRYGDGVERLEALWRDRFVPVSRSLNIADCPVVSWDNVAAHLRLITETIQVREINGSSADVLNYEEQRDVGLNVVAVGGDKLARGLTLEGLSTSYFLRGSRMYDTLMQMGRWFGYRKGYLDLCRLYTTSDLVDWYEHITLASEELRRELDRMEAIKATPSDFGLRVRSHPMLYVTSRAKMRHGSELRLSFAGDVSETTVFATNQETLRTNFDAASELVARIGDDFNYVKGPDQAGVGGDGRRRNNAHYWSRIPASIILEFLDRFLTHPDAPRANSQLLARYIRRQNQIGELTSWSLFLAAGDGVETVILGGRDVPAVIRQPKGGYEDGGELLTIKEGERFLIRRLLNPTDEGVDITHAGYDAAMHLTLSTPPKRRRASDSTEAPSKPSEVFLRRQRSAQEGLLLLYPLAREARVTFEGQSFTHRFLDIPEHIIGLGISFPESRSAEKVTYVVNSVYDADDEGEV